MKFTTLIIALALVASVTTAQADALVMTPVMPGIGQHFTWVVGKKYPVVVFFKDGSKRYFLGAFVGYMAVHDSKHSFHGTDWMPTGKPVEVAGVEGNAAKAGGVYRAFKGEHSTLLYIDNHNWFIMKGGLK